MKLLSSTKSKVTKYESCENVPHLKITEVILIHSNFVNHDYQQDSRVLYTFVPNKPFVQLLESYLTNFIFLKSFDSKFSCIKVWFTDKIINRLRQKIE